MEKILELINNYKKDKEVGKGKKITGIIVGVVALIALAVLSWRLWKLGKERAKLLHEKAVNEEKEHQAKVDSEILVHEEEKQEALETVEKLKDQLDVLEENLLNLEEERAHNLELVRSINSWGDVDEIVR